jgi:hypothetical protein
MVLSALAGATVEIPVGVGASGPTLSDVASETGLPRQDFIDPVVDVAILLSTVMLVVISALIPAIRAARTDSVRAISLRSAPIGLRRSRLADGLSRLGAPRTVSLGAGDAFVVGALAARDAHLHMGDRITVMLEGKRVEVEIIRRRL